MQREVEKNLTAIAQLKANQIIDWRKDQLEDAALLANPLLIADILSFMADPNEKMKKNSNWSFRI